MARALRVLLDLATGDNEEASVNQWMPGPAIERLWPSSAPVVMIDTAVERGLVGWNLGENALGSIAFPPEIGALKHFLAPGGTSVIEVPYVDHQVRSTEYHPKWVATGVFTVDVQTGVRTRANLELRTSTMPNTVSIGIAPLGERFVAAQWWNVREWQTRPDFERMPPREQISQSEAWMAEGWAANRTTLWDASFGNVPPKEIATLQCTAHVRDRAPAVQWSPDGAYVAVSCLGTDRPAPGMCYVLVYDAVTWDVIRVFHGGSLAGSVAWGPGSDRLLLEHYEDEIWVQHLDGDREIVTVLPPPDRDYFRPIRPLGLADNTHLLAIQVRRSRATILRISLDDGAREPVLSWNSGPNSYPVLAHMPPETWEPRGPAR